MSELQGRVERLQRELEQEVLRREEVGAGWSQSEPKLRLRVGVWYLGGGARVESVGVRGPPERGRVLLGGGARVGSERSPFSFAKMLHDHCRNAARTDS